VRAAWLRISRTTWLKRGLSVTILVFSLVFLGYKVYKSWDALRNYDWQIRYIHLIPSFGLFLLQLVVVTWGWQSIMSSLAKPLPFRKHLKVYGSTNLVRRIPAGMLWMVAGRAYAYHDPDVSVHTSAVGSLLEFLLVVLSALPLSALAGWTLGFLLPQVGASLAVVAMVLELSILHPVVLAKVLRLVRHQALNVELTYHRTLLWAGVYTLIWLVSGTGLFAVARLFTDLPPSRLLATVGIWVLSSLVSYLTVLSPSGFGVKELSLAFLLGLVVPDPLPLLIAMGIRIIWTVYDIVVGIVVLLL